MQAMHIPRHLRFLMVCLTLCSMFFMQLAAAAYVCPMTQNGAAGAAMAQSVAAMPDCAGMAQGQRALCHLQLDDQQGKQSADPAHLPPVRPFVAASLTVALDFPDTVLDTLPMPAAAATSQRGGAPPMTIRHCCFRI